MHVPMMYAYPVNDYCYVVKFVVGNDIICFEYS